MIYKKIILVSILAAIIFNAEVNARVDNPRLLTDKSYDCSSLDSIIKTVIKPGMTNDEKAIAIYDFCRFIFYHFPYPVEEKSSIGPLKAINVYGWSLCGGLHTVLGELYKKAGFEYRYRGWNNPGHTTIEVFYDGKWHYLDVFLCFYAWTLDKKTIAGQDDIIKNPDIALKAEVDKRGPPNILSCGDPKESVVSGCKSSNIMKDWGGSISKSDGDYTLDYYLIPGQSLQLNWGKVSSKSFYGYFEKQFFCPQHTCGMKDFRTHPVQGPLLEHYGPKSFDNGILSWKPDLNNSSFLEDIETKENIQVKNGKILPLIPEKPAILIMKMASPYVLINANVEVEFEREDSNNKVSFSTNKAVWNDNMSELEKTVKGLYCYYVKFTTLKGIKSLKVESLVQHNSRALPFLVNGENKITIKVKDPLALSKNKLVVSYAYEEANAKSNRSQFNGRDIEYSEEKVITKEIDKSPYEFTVNVGGNTPPKMKYIKYEVK
jgi:hypothetical protein